MLPTFELTKVLFLDIETVSNFKEYGELDEDWKSLWATKANALARGRQEPLEEKAVADKYTDRGAIYSEFGRIVCISVGILLRDWETKEMRVRLTSFYGEDEKKILEDFANLLAQYYPDPAQFYLCGHNIKEFDIPYICRRMVIHALELPGMLQLAGKKPWETKYILDTMDLWRFGDFKNYTSLKLLTKLFKIPSPKDDIDGSDVGRVFWEEKDVERIARYCEKDVLAIVQLMLRFQRMPLIENLNVVHV
ncbi:MAG: 3'-5' exonuclease [Saprospiraceae bacterium]|nr:3'-5' exonuclease [Saprospiraceae bacterium]